MPETIPSYRLTEDQQKKALAWIDSHLKKCPICSANQFSLNINAAEVRTFTSGALMAPGYVFPQLVVTCNKCAHTMLFNAVQAGVLQTNEEGEVKDGK